MIDVGIDGSSKKEVGHNKEAGWLESLMMNENIKKCSHNLV